MHASLKSEKLEHTDNTSRTVTYQSLILLHYLNKRLAPSLSHSNSDVRLSEHYRLEMK